MSTQTPTVLLSYNGLRLVSRNYNQGDQNFMLEVQDDMECEQETIGFEVEWEVGVEEDEEDDSQEDTAEHDSIPNKHSTNQDTDHPMDGSSPVASGSHNAELKPELKDVLTNASKGVSEGTDAAYRTLMRQLTRFAQGQNLIGPTEEFFRSEPHQESAEIIVAWILSVCNSFRLDGSTKPSSEERRTYTHAQKMRAAATFGFGRVCGLGTRPWERSKVTGRMLGNPSVSQQVSLYMVSLRRRKAPAGETPTSARAVDAETIGKLYDFNVKPENRTIRPFAPGKRRKTEAEMEKWGGGRFRRLLHCAYTIMFSCLLRVDEVLKIQIHDIERLLDSKGKVLLKLTLPFRKTDQFGDIQPFFLRELPYDMRHLCPVRAYADWIDTSQLTDGYLFRKIGKGDRLDTANKPMTSAQFLEGFRNNLLDIKIDPEPYGTHSFRRGGCQWLSVDLRWPLRK
ncbi:hypothetical protein AAF712_016594, partial [Marasmius tenuissimus]